MNRINSPRHISLHSRIKNVFFYRSGGKRETVILKTRRKDFTWSYPEKSILRLTQRVSSSYYRNSILKWYFDALIQCSRILVTRTLKEFELAGNSSYPSSSYRGSTVVGFWVNLIPVPSTIGRFSVEKSERCYSICRSAIGQCGLDVCARLCRSRHSILA